RESCLTALLVHPRRGAALLRLPVHLVHAVRERASGVRTAVPARPPAVAALRRRPAGPADRGARHRLGDVLRPVQHGRGGAGGLAAAVPLTAGRGRVPGQAAGNARAASTVGWTGMRVSSAVTRRIFATRSDGAAMSSRQPCSWAVL